MDEVFDMEDIQNEDDNFFFEDKIEVQKILYDTLNEELKTYLENIIRQIDSYDGENLIGMEIQ